MLAAGTPAESATPSSPRRDTAGVRGYLLDALSAGEQEQLAVLLIKVLDHLDVHPQPPL